jgi:hypothetical protein
MTGKHAQSDSMHMYQWLRNQTGSVTHRLLDPSPSSQLQPCVADCMSRAPPPYHEFRTPP